MGTGWIADRFVASLQHHSSQQIAAVGSRRQDTAAEFARRFGIPRAHGSYEELVADPDVDVVYIATPHNAHLDGAVLALQAGKHTLVEKPLAMNADQAQQIADPAGRAACSAWRRTGPRSCPSTTCSSSFSTPGARGHHRRGRRLRRVVPTGPPNLPPGAGRRSHARPGHYLVGFVVNVLGASRTDPRQRHPRHRRPRPDGHDPDLRRPAGGAAHHDPHQHTDQRDHRRQRATLTIDGPFYQPGGFTVTATDGRRLRYNESAYRPRRRAPLPSGRGRPTDHRWRNRSTPSPSRAEHPNPRCDGPGARPDRRPLP